MASLNDVLSALQNGVVAINKLNTQLNSTFPLQQTVARGQVVNVVDFGADPSGTSESATSIQDAIDSLGVRGGDVFFPAGNYRVSTTINIGDGDSTNASTRWGVYLVGEGATVSTTDGDLNDGGNSTSMMSWHGAAGDPLLVFNGPLDGWGVRHLGFNCRSVAGYGIRLLDAANGHASDVTIRGATITNLDILGVSATLALSASYSTFERLWIAMTPSGVTSKGISIDGVGGAFFNNFFNVGIVLPNSATANYGVYLGFCDSNFFTGLQMSAGGAGSNSVVFDYTSAGTFPNSNGFIGCDIGAKAMLEIAPGGAPVQDSNFFYGFSRGNGMAPPGFDSVVCIDGITTRTRPVTFANLDAVTNNSGARSVVSNSSTVVFNAIVGGTGGTTVPVWCDGTNWRVG